MFTQPTQIPRSPFASTLTIAVHVCLGLVVIVLATAMPSIPKIAAHESLTFIMAEALPALEFEMPAPPPPDAPRLEIPRPEPPKAMEAPVIEPPPPPPPVERRVVEPPKEVKAPPPVPKPPQVVVGAFSDPTAAARVAAVKPIAPAGFESAAEQTKRARAEVTAVGGFDTNLPESTRPDRTALVRDAGFGTTSDPAPTRTAPRSTTAAGFSTDPSPRATAAPPPTVGAAGFGADPKAAPAARPAPRPAARPQADRPVDVLSKPTPAYTDEARAKGIEGEVSLEVEFTAAGHVRVLRVIRGLGHGLDEMARRAAEGIRFRPATSKGVPVDFRATLTIVFRLT
jgi:TonB family protein